MLQGSLFGSVVRAGIYRQASRACGSLSGRQFHGFPTKSSGLINSPKIDKHLPSILGKMGMKLGLVRMAENVPLPCALSFRSSIHSGDETEGEAGKSPNPKSMSYEQFSQESGNGATGKPPLDIGAGRNLRSMGYDELSMRERRIGVPPFENQAGRTQPPLDIGAGRNLRSMDYDELSMGERRIGVPPFENQAGRTQPPFENRAGRMQPPFENRAGRMQPPFENRAGSTPMSMNYVQGLLHNSGVNGGLAEFQQDVEAGRIPRPLDDVPAMYPGRGNVLMGGAGPYYNQPQLESNADIVHIKLMRNNSFVTLTDHKGNRKVSVSAGQVAAKGDKPGRYAGEAASEYMGRVVKQMKIRSVVVKVSGFTFFRRKKDSILAFKDGFTHSRGDYNPVVYVEDTTRKPHNGCRRPKKRRI